MWNSLQNERRDNGQFNINHIVYQQSKFKKSLHSNRLYYAVDVMEISMNLISLHINPFNHVQIISYRL